MNKYLGKISKQRFDILPEYKILVIHIDSKVFNTVVKKYFNANYLKFKMNDKRKGTFKSISDLQKEQLENSSFKN